jgi:hypothetical protein
MPKGSQLRRKGCFPMNLKKPTHKWSGEPKKYARCVYRRLSDDLFSVLCNLAGRRPGNQATSKSLSATLTRGKFLTQRHATRPRLLEQVRHRRHPVDDGDDLIRLAPGTRWGLSMSPPPDKSRTGAPAYERIFAAPRSRPHLPNLGDGVSKRRRVPVRKGPAGHRPSRSSLDGENAPYTRGWDP